MTRRDSLEPVVSGRETFQHQHWFAHLLVLDLLVVEWPRHLHPVVLHHARVVCTAYKHHHPVVLHHARVVCTAYKHHHPVLSVLHRNIITQWYFTMPESSVLLTNIITQCRLYCIETSPSVICTAYKHWYFTIKCRLYCL